MKKLTRMRDSRLSIHNAEVLEVTRLPEDRTESLPMNMFQGFQKRTKDTLFNTPKFRSRLRLKDGEEVLWLWDAEPSFVSVGDKFSILLGKTSDDDRWMPIFFYNRTAETICNAGTTPDTGLLWLNKERDTWHILSLFALVAGAASFCSPAPAWMGVTLGVAGFLSSFFSKRWLREKESELAWRCKDLITNMEELQALKADLRQSQ